MVFRILTLCTCLAGLCIARPTHAEDARAQEAASHEGEPAEYRALIGQALEEYDAHNFEEARALFLRAHAVSPSARTLRGLGMVEFELRNYTDSVARLEEALASSEKRLNGELRTNTETLLARARGYVAELVVETVPSVRRGLRLSIDGEPRAYVPGVSLKVNVGERVLQVQAPGYQDEKRSLSLKAAEQRRVRLELRRRSADASASVGSSQEEARPLRRNPWLWTGIAALVVGGVVAGVLLARQPDKKDPEPIAGDIGGVVYTLGAR